MTLIAFMSRTLPYILGSPFFEVGYDTGYYQNFVREYQDASSWDALPAYPDVPVYDQKRWFDPGFFVTLAVANGIMQSDMSTIFRFLLPAIAGTLMVTVAFLLGRQVGEQNIAGGVAALFVALSYLQVSSIYEAYYKQVFASILLMASLIYLQRFLRRGGGQELIPFAVLFSGTVFLHMPVAFLGTLLVLLLVSIRLVRGDGRSVKGMMGAASMAAIISLPAWASRWDVIRPMMASSLEQSIWRTSTIASGEGRWEAGGSMPELFWGYDHVVFGYVELFIPFILLTAISYWALYKKGRLGQPVVVLSILIWTYAGLWMFFGNRFLANLDMALCVIAPMGLILLFERIRDRRVLAASLVVMILAFVPVSSTVLDYQTDIAPSITENMDGVEWIIENIDREGSVIFAPDYLSAYLLQLDYEMAVWDHYLSRSNADSLPYAEDFMAYSPSNLSYIENFFSLNPEYLGFDIYVLWGEWDSNRRLISNGELIPMDEYEGSEWFQRVYHGSDEILDIYRFTGIP